MREKPESRERAGLKHWVVCLRSDRTVTWFDLDVTSLASLRIQGRPGLIVGVGFSEILSPRNCFVCPKYKPTHVSPSSGQSESAAAL